MSDKSKKLSQVNTILFDLDGTLMDSNGIIIDSWQHTVRELAGWEISVKEVYTTFGEMLVDSMRRLIPEVDIEYARDFFRDYQREFFLDKVRFFDGTEEMLRRTKAAGYKNAIVTSRLKTSTEKALNHFNIRELFDAVLTASDTEKFKPDPTPLFMTLDMVDSKPEEAIIIGDTVHDIEAGRAAGTMTALVDWSIAVPPEKREEEPVPDFIIEKLLDIPDMMGI